MSNQLFSKDELKKFKETYKKLVKDDEFEIMFGGYHKNNSINMEQFLSILKYLKVFGEKNKYKIEYTNNLDISYNYDTTNFHTYRLSVSTIDKINTQMAMLHNRNNNIIMSILVSKYLNEKDEDITIINKTKSFDNTYNLEDYDIRIRLSKENKVTKSELTKLTNIDDKESKKILFRYKNRYSVIVENNSDVEIRIDLTSVKQGNNINRLQKFNYNYELEIDFNKKKKLTAAKEKKYLDQLLDLVTHIKLVIQQSNYIISKTKSQSILNVYNKLIYGEENTKYKSLYVMPSTSLEVLHIVDYLPNKYSISDKADGEHHIGIIYENELYLINSNLLVKRTGMKLDKKLSKYNNTLIDGEYLYNSEHGKYMFLCFDILFLSGEDIRNESKLTKRLEYLQDVLSNCFNENFNHDDYNDEFNIDKIVDFHKKGMKSYLTTLNKRLKTEKSDHIITRKYFMFAKGGSDIEIFRYASEMWNTYTKDKSVSLPYMLDGLMFTPLDQIYTKNKRDTRYRIYKWKPPSHNSIDFFVRFEKNPQTKAILNVYDDSNESKVGGKVYRVANLHVGKSINNIEMPVLFKKEENLHIANLFVENNTVKDIEGNIIQDNTVVEFSYNNDNEVPPNFRWVPLRTRYDKTETVRKISKKYGNNSMISSKIWNSIQQNVAMDDLMKLSNEKLYDNHLNELKKRITASIIAIEKQEDAYYQKITNLARSMRDFHNYIKSNIIFTYCSPKMINGKLEKQTVLDFGCGRGGDIQKFFTSRINYYVGIDPDANGIYGSATDGAYSRYNTLKKKMPFMPKMDFMVGNPAALLNYQAQSKIIGKTNDNNINLLRKYFGATNNSSDYKFNVINMNFMIHFLFKDDISLNNLFQNINDYIDDEGYILITNLDGDLIHNKLKKNGKFTYNYTDENGKRKKFIEFVRKYDPKINKINETGLAYNAHLTWINSDNKSITEYLVGKDFLINKFTNESDFDLIETELFGTIHEHQRNFFENVAPYEENKSSKRYFMKVKEYYNSDDEINRICLEYSKLHRYYVFKKRKTTGNKVKVVRKSSKKGGNLTKNKVKKKSNYVDI